MLTATLLSNDRPLYLKNVAARLPTNCPRCGAINHLILDSDDVDFAYCWSHFGEVYIGPSRTSHFRVREHSDSQRHNSKFLSEKEIE